MVRRPLSQAPFCERNFWRFLILWGCALQLEHFIQLSDGRFYRAFEARAPGWAWGLFMIALGLARVLAYFYGTVRLRVALSTTTMGLFWVVAALAFYEGLYGATAPIAVFIAFLATSCHRRTLRASFNWMAKAPPPA